MSELRTIHIGWYNGSIRTTGGSQLAYQYDHLSNLVIFDDAPRLDNYYLIVEMKETEDGPVRTLEPIQLGGSFWLIPNSYTQLAQNISFQVCCKTPSGDFERHSAQFTGMILPSKNHDGAALDVDPSIMYDPYKQWVSDIAMAAGAIVIDEDLDTAGAAADAKATGDALTELNERLEQIEGGGDGLTADVKAALLACFNHVAWDSADPTGQSYISALQTALYPPANLTSISAVYTQSGAVLEGASLDTLKSDLVVTAHYSDNTSGVVTSYALSGTLAEGTSTITVTYGGKTTTFNVTVTKVITGWLYRFEQSLASSGTEDFGFTGAENYVEGATGSGYAYHHLTTTGDATADVGAIVASGYEGPDLSGDFTIAFWWKTYENKKGQGVSAYTVINSTNSIGSHFVSTPTTASGWTATVASINRQLQGFRMSYLSDKINIRLMTPSSSNGSNIVVTPPSSFDSTQWHHFALTRSGSTIRFFVDGQIVFTTESSLELFWGTQFCVGSFYEGVGSTTPKATSYGNYYDDLYVAESCKWTEAFDPTAITY